jgi:hypothetical protein
VKEKITLGRSANLCATVHGPKFNATCDKTMTITIVRGQRTGVCVTKDSAIGTNAVVRGLRIISGRSTTEAHDRSYEAGAIG